MRLSLIAPALFTVFAAAPAFAQIPLGAKPTVVKVTDIPEAYRLIGLDDIAEDQYITLEWRATVLTTDTYNFEITYDRATDTSTTATLVPLDENEFETNRNQGTVQSGITERFYIKPSQVVRRNSAGEITPLDDQKRNIVVKVFRASSPTDVNTYETVVFEFNYDTKPPPAITITDLVSGENKLEVKWAVPSPDTDVLTYEVVYCPQLLEPPEGELAELPCDASAQVVKEGVPKTQTAVNIVDGLANDVLAAVAVRAEDKYNNPGPLGNVLVERPSPVTDFFELYKDEGGLEDGGFCFIATAAYGSYAHPTVRVLRFFRDYGLAPLPGGDWLIQTYYAISPPIAAIVADSPLLAAFVRAMLIPVALLAILWMLSPLIVIGWLMSFVVRHRGRRVLVGSAMIVCLFAASSARAEEQLNRSRSEATRFGIGFEFKGGPYLPAIGDETGTTAGRGAFERIFKSRPRALYSIGADVQLFRSGGTAGIGGSFGFMQFVGRSLYGRSGDIAPADTTVFNLMPLTLTAFYRFDWLADRTPVPLVPYLRGGLAYHIWWVTQSTGDIARWNGPTDNVEDDVAGRGGKFGLIGVAGISLLLNTLDMDASRALFDSTGIRGTYIFAEYQISKVDGFGADGFDLSDDTWALGVYFEW